MSSATQGGGAEIVIIRRKGPDEVAAHKGGAWKIAYADFVTAMMAFFLVMWLINAANEATRAQVASYFNPIKLTDNATGGRGLNDPKDLKSKDKTPGSGTAEKATEAEKKQEQQTLADPMKTLDRVAGTAPAAPKIHTEQAGGPASDTLNDPFDPQAWQALASSGQSADPSTEAKKAAVTSPPATPTEDRFAAAADAREKPALPAAPALGMLSPGHDNRAKAPGVSAPPKPAMQLETTEALPSAQSVPALNPDTRTHVPQAAEAVSETESGKAHLPQTAAANQNSQTKASIDEPARAAADIKAEILKKLNIDPGDLPADIEVKATPEGQLISLTDRTAFGMFQVGSSEPDAKLVAIVSAIAQVIKDRPGYLVIRGHTDSRPYRNRHFDNWQLSAARAQMTYYMLLRGGVDDTRVKRIEGLADRDPLVPAHPDAPENRRIEILLGQMP